MKRIKITKENCIATTHPEIAAQWHPTLNEGITPFDVRAGSVDRVWWLCDKGHPWEIEVRVRCKMNNGCPYCRGTYAFPGETDLLSQYPDIAKEWDYDANGDLKPEAVPRYSNKYVYWRCEKGHSWKAQVLKRTQRNQGCPYCSGRKAIPGETDIATLNPELMELWDYEKNAEEGIYPENIKPYSDVKTWWKCKEGHSWKTKTKELTRGRRCPICASRVLAPGINDLATVNPKLAEEWHPTKNGDLEPSMIMAHYSKKVWWECLACGYAWRATPDGRIGKKSGCPACARSICVPGVNDVATAAEWLLNEWDYQKNRAKKPENTAVTTAKKVWWKCSKCGYSWRASLNGRSKGAGCPKCARKVR